MSLTTTEYAVQRRSVAQDSLISQHGPYDTFELADQQRRSGERITAEGMHQRWVVVERDVTPWTVVPKHSRDWPDDD